MPLRLVMIMLATSATCAHNPGPLTLRAPNPSGCCAIVYDQPQFTGVADLLNGPVRFATLRALSQANHKDWHKRIRSVKVGTAASLTVYTRQTFTGHSARFEAAAESPRLNRSLSGNIQSLELTCTAARGPRVQELRTSSFELAVTGG